MLVRGAQLFEANPATISAQPLNDAQLQLSQIHASRSDLLQKKPRDARQGCEPERDERLWQVGEDQEYTCSEGGCGHGLALQHQGPEFHSVERQDPQLDYLHGCCKMPAVGSSFGLSDAHICTACPPACLTGPTNSCSECRSSCLLRWLYVRLASRNRLEGRCCGVGGTRSTELRWMKRRETGNAGPPARSFPLFRLGATL